jgi:hypothetical protein
MLNKGQKMNGVLHFVLGKLARDDAMKNYSWYQNGIFICLTGIKTISCQTE